MDSNYSLDLKLWSRTRSFTTVHPTVQRNRLFPFLLTWWYVLTLGALWRDSIFSIWDVHWCLRCATLNTEQMLIWAGLWCLGRHLKLDSSTMNFLAVVASCQWSCSIAHNHLFLLKKLDNYILSYMEQSYETWACLYNWCFCNGCLCFILSITRSVCTFQGGIHRQLLLICDNLARCSVCSGVAMDPSLLYMAWCLKWSLVLGAKKLVSPASF